MSDTPTTRPPCDIRPAYHIQSLGFPGWWHCEAHGVLFNREGEQPEICPVEEARREATFPKKERNPPFTIQPTPKGYEGSNLVLADCEGSFAGLDGRGSLHGQVQRAILALGYPISVVPDYLADEEAANEDFVRWMAEEKKTL